jgi:hypothetical protein
MSFAVGRKDAAQDKNILKKSLTKFRDSVYSTL